MLVPLSWLKDYVDIDVEPKELEKKLFSCGFEVVGRMRKNSGHSFKSLQSKCRGRRASSDLLWSR